MDPMAYCVQWQLVGRSGRPLDCGGPGEGLYDYRDAVAAVHEFLRSYPVVSRSGEENYWRARRSSDADLRVLGIDREPNHLTCCQRQRRVLCLAPAEAAGLEQVGWLNNSVLEIRRKEKLDATV
jgi:hypothetical protein